jgi:hypothetical protein
MQFAIALFAILPLVATAQAWSQNCIPDQPQRRLGVHCQEYFSTLHTPSKVAVFDAAKVWCAKHSKRTVGYGATFSALLNLDRVAGGGGASVAFVNSEASEGWQINYDDCLAHLTGIAASCPGPDSKTTTRGGARQTCEGTVKLQMGGNWNQAWELVDRVSDEL